MSPSAGGWWRGADRTLRCFIKRALYRYGYGTACRNRAAARAVGSLARDSVLIAGAPAVLDVGCGDRGLSAFLSGVSILGVDIVAPGTGSLGFPFQQADVTSLPFPDRSFPIVSCVDVLEHLSPAAREAAIGEMVRVARSALVVACPHGAVARLSDDWLARQYHDRGKPLPSWLEEHRKQPYPDISQIAEGIGAACAGGARMEISYCEAIAASRVLRWLSARSQVLYLVAELALGACLPLLPGPVPERAYRAILIVRFSEHVSDPDRPGSDPKASVWLQAQRGYG